jgi:phage-related protein (TIGR01555 family)
MERAQQAVHSIPGLTNILRAPGGENLIRQRVDLVDMSRSVNNAVVIDGEETYDILSTSFASVSDIIDRLTLALCAVSDIPEQLLFGRQVGGINSNGQSSLESWYAKVGAWQRQRLLPILDRLTTLVLLSKGKYTPDYTIKFKPLWVPSEKEEAETCERKAKTAEIYVNMGALDPSEVRKHIADEYNIDNVELIPEMPDDGEENDTATA